MKHLPLYDAEAAIACTISDDEKPGRIDSVLQMKAALTSLERTADGMVLHFPSGAEIEQTVRQFAIDEKRCCEFWGFAVESSAEGLSLRWDAPPDAIPLIDSLEEFFTSDKSLSELAGLVEGI